MRYLRGVQSAELTSNPWGKAPKATGARAAGLRFERNIGKLLPEALHNQWIKFVDNAGPGYCCPDYLFAYAGTLFVVECKLTDVGQAADQLQWLYAPVLRLLWPGPIGMFTVAKYLSPVTKHPVTNWTDAMAVPLATLHAFRGLAPPSVSIERPTLLRSCNLIP